MAFFFVHTETYRENTLIDVPFRGEQISPYPVLVVFSVVSYDRLNKHL